MILLSQLAIQKALNNEWQEAVVINEQILAEDPENIDALNRLAQAYLQLGKFKNAKTVYQQVLELDRFNPIAKRNIIKLQEFKENSHIPATKIIPFNFIEEPGKTKIVNLVRLGERSILSVLQCGVELEFDVRVKNIYLYYDKKYVGKLPDDISKRLIWLYKRDNKYSACVKSIEKNKVSVFIKEIKCSSKNRNFSCF